MSAPVPRTNIPETWAAQGHCPVCRATPLSRRRLPAAPDQLQCAHCGTAFELEQDGPRLRLTHWPAPLTPFLQTAESDWLTRAEIKDAVQKAAHPPQTEDGGRMTAEAASAALPSETPLTPEASPPPPVASAPVASPPAPEAPPPPPVESAPAAPIEEALPDVNAFVERALALYALGNTPPVIRASLINVGAEPEQIEMALVEVYERERQKRKQQRTRLQWVSRAAALMLVLLFAAFVVMGGLSPRPAAPIEPGTAVAQVAPPLGTPTATPLPYNPIVELINNLMPKGVHIANGPSPTPGPTRTRPPTLTVGPGTPLPPTETPLPTLAGGLPGWVLTLAPPGATVIGVATPSVERGIGPGKSACPNSPADAARLFGGEPKHWTYASDTGGWMLIVAGDPITIQVPDGMSAGYLVIGQTLYMTSVGGPAIIHNINFAAVSCE